MPTPTPLPVYVVAYSDYAAGVMATLVSRIQDVAGLLMVLLLVQLVFVVALTFSVVWGGRG